MSEIVGIERGADRDHRVIEQVYSSGSGADLVEPGGIPLVSGEAGYFVACAG